MAKQQNLLELAIFNEADRDYIRNRAIDTLNWQNPIILIHSIHEVDPPALDLIIQGLKDRGYGFGTLPRPEDNPITAPTVEGQYPIQD